MTDPTNHLDGLPRQETEDSSLVTSLARGLPLLDGAVFEQFCVALTECRGERLALHTQSRLKEPMSIRACIEEYPSPTGKSGPEKILYVDLYAEDFFSKGRHVPIGHSDWNLDGDTAHGHEHSRALSTPTLSVDLIPYRAPSQYGVEVSKETVRERCCREHGASERMNLIRQAGLITSDSDWTAPIYQSRGLGQLLISTSLILLEAQGVKNLDLGKLPNAGRGLWSKFGVTNDDAETVLVAELVEHPLVTTNILRAISFGEQ